VKTATLVLILLVAGSPVLAGLGLTLAQATTPGGWATMLQFPGLARSLAISVWTGLAGVLIALGLAHLALATAATTAWTERIRTITLPMIALPHLAVGIGLALLLAPSGLLLRMLSPWATGLDQPPDRLWIHDPFGLSLIAGLVVKETPFLVLMLLVARAQVPVERLVLQCRSLGYGRTKAWWVAVAPLLQRQIRLPFAAALVFGMTNVEMAIPLGPSMPPPFSVVLWQWFTASRLELRGAAFAGSVLLLVATLGALAAVFAASRLARAVHHAYATSGARGSSSVVARIGMAAPLGFVAALGVGSVVAIVLRAASPMWRFPSVLPTRIDVRQLVEVAPPLGTALTSTIALGSASAALATAIVLLASEVFCNDAAWRRRVGALLFAPLLLPQLAFLFGVQWLLVRLKLDGTGWAVAWEHTVFALPYTWAILTGSRAALDPRLVTVARSLGAGPIRTWWTVTFPLLLRSTLVAMAIAFSVSAALYLPTLFAGAGRVITVATEAASAAASGNLRVAAVNAAAQAAAPVIALVLSTLAARAVYRNRQGVPT
jgi:putative thiamine transport system permease protein